MTIKGENERILHCVKRLVAIESLFNSQMDELLELLNLTREEVKSNGKDKRDA